MSNIGKDPASDADRFKIQLKVNDKFFDIAEDIAMQIIDPSSYEQYKIPSSVSTACGGWWAGGGTWYYAQQDERGDILVMEGYDGEGMSPEERFKYKEKLKISKDQI